MRGPIFKSAIALVVLGLLLPGALIMTEAPMASAAPTFGRVTVSGTNILVDGAVPAEKFFGVDDTTALQFAIMTYINGEQGVRGWSSVFNTPDTPNYARSPVVPNDSPENFWHQYFALLQYYDCNLVRIGCGDAWGTELQYNAWLNHRDAYISLLRTMCEQAEAHGVWVTLVLAGSQEWPTYQYRGSGVPFDPSSQAFANWATYCRDIMAALEDENAICWYDLYNEPDHNFVADGYWRGDKVRFNTWAKAAVAATDGVSTHPRTMGVAALGNLFGWNKADFDLAVGTIGVEVLHVHYYGANYDANNFALPESWARQNGRPLFWGELGWNGQYPLTRYTFAENAIWEAGGQAIASMVLTGTPGYPYYGGSLVDVHPDPEPVDATPPSLAITAPADGAVTGSSVTASWSGSDASGVKGFQHRLDGEAWSALSSATSITVGQLPDGEHVIEVRAEDNAGNAATASARFTVDTSVPAVAVVAPADGTITTSSTVEVAWESEDPASLVRAEVRVDGGEWTAAEDGASTFVLSGLADGEHVIEVKGVYASGGSVVDSVRVEVSTAAPGAVRGEVQDPAGRPLAGATVVLDTGASAVTDVTGTFTFEVEPGTYTATVSKEGYRSASVAVPLDRDKVAVVGLFELEPGAQPAGQEDGSFAILLMVSGLAILVVVLFLAQPMTPRRRA